MNDANEIIEAKLAAYIDGDLSLADRGEIEAYLRTHPEYAVAVEEMRRVRTVLRSASREKAPPELLDHLQQHLERSALLDDATPAVAGRISRWPQWFAAAAMLMLAGGLGLAVFQILPRDGTESRSVAVAPTNRPEEGLLSTRETGPRANASAAKDGVVARSRVHQTQNQDADEKDAIANAGASRGGIGLRNANPFRLDGGSAASVARGTPDQAAFAAPDPDREKKIATPAFAGLDANTDPVLLDNAVAVVIDTDDPALTGNLIAGYLVQNNIPFARVDNPADARQQAVATLPDLPNSARTNVAKTAVPLEDADLDEQVRRSMRQSQNDLPQAELQQQALARENMQVGQSSVPPGLGEAASREIAAAGSTISDSSAKASRLRVAEIIDHLRGPATGDSGLAAVRRKNEILANASTPGVSEATEEEVLLVLRGLDASQVEALKASLHAQRTGRQATRFVDNAQLATAESAEKAKEVALSFPLPDVSVASADSSVESKVAETTQRAGGTNLSPSAPTRAVTSPVPDPVAPVTSNPATTNPVASNPVTAAPATPVDVAAVRSERPASKPSVNPSEVDARDTASRVADQAKTATTTVPLASLPHGQTSDTVAPTLRPTTTQAIVHERADVVVLVRRRIEPAPTTQPVTDKTK